MNEKFPKTEKLKRDKIIEQLFKKGESVKSFPLVLVYLQTNLPENVPIQAGFSVPKRNHKLAVTRNRLKRLMREAYRKQKNSVSLEETQFAFMFIYVGREKMDHSTIYRAMEKLLVKFKSSIGTTQNED